MKNMCRGMIMVWVFSALVATALEGQESRLVDLKIELPKPVQAGTPKEIKGTNLDPLRKPGKRPALFSCREVRPLIPVIPVRSQDRLT